MRQRLVRSASALPAPHTDLVEIYDPRFGHYVLDNACLETLAGGFRWIEGLVWMGDANCLLFQDLPRNRTMRWIEGAGVSVYRAPSAFANGQARDREGRLITCSHLDRCLYRTELDGSVTRLVDRHDDKRLNAPNDVTVRSDGTIWFTDPLYGIQNDYEGWRQVSEQPPALYRFDPVSGAITVTAADFDGPNGLVFSPDEKLLYVSETGDQTGDDPKQYIRIFKVAENGGLSGGSIFHKIAPGYADGLAMDTDGNIWSGAGDGVHCLAPDGTLLGKILVPYRVSNLTFGGVARNRLFIGGSHTLYTIFLNRRGAGWP
jgi:gluconolactonase